MPVAIRDDDHTDWLHDGHLHAVLERHVTSSLRPFSSDA